jgi:aspartate racemase
MSHKTIGIIGGTSPESTAVYYQTIVRRHIAWAGDHSYPRILIASVSFQQYIDWQHDGSWDQVAAGLQQEADALERAGADLLLLAANTMHKVLPSLHSRLPFISVMDAVARVARERGICSVGLTGTRFTMADGFYDQGLIERGLQVVLPDQAQQQEIHRMIYDELISGQVRPASVSSFAAIARDLQAQGAEATLLACTELELLDQDGQLGVPIIDSTNAHATLAWKLATGQSSSD